MGDQVLKHGLNIGAILLAACALAAGGCASSGRQAPGLIAPTTMSTSAAGISSAFDRAVAAQKAEEAGKRDEAIALYREALKEYREFPAAWNNLGVILLDSERYLEAAECFAAASDLAPRDPRPAYNTGLSWDRAGYLNEAIEHYRESLARDGRYLPALRGSIRAERLLGKASSDTLERIRAALLLEQDEQWREWLELQRVRVEAELAGKRYGG